MPYTDFHTTKSNPLSEVYYYKLQVDSFIYTITHISGTRCPQYIEQQLDDVLGDSSALYFL